MALRLSNWIEGTGDYKSRRLLEIVQRRSLTQPIDFPTHQRGALLDFALLDRNDNIYGIENLGYVGKSDHVALLFEIDVDYSFNDTTEKIRDWAKGDKPALSEYFSNIKWQDELLDLSTEQAWDFLNNKIEEGLNRYIPLKNRRSRFKPPWLTKKVKQISSRKKRLWRIYRNTKAEQDHINFKKCEKECAKAVRSAKRRFEQNISRKENKRLFNSYVKRKIRSKTGVGPVKVNGKVVQGDDETAKVLNDYFCSVFNQPDAPEDVPQVTHFQSNSVLDHIRITPAMVLDKINKLKPDGAPGPDGISNRFLKEFKNELAPALCIIYRKSLLNSSVPFDWRSANITPIFKKGSKSDPGNYRPVSLTSVCCKLLESIIGDRITEHLTSNNLLRSSQHGFCKKKSCTTNLLEFLEQVLSKIDQGIPVDIAYLDFSKAFDKVPWRRLIAKVMAHQIRGDMLKWIESWLSDRKQRVVINGKMSPWAAVTSGVPQGSVLGPLLFLLYINDIDEATGNSSFVRKFADDTKVGHEVKSETDARYLEDTLEAMHSWAQDWGMSFNLSKCKIMHIGRGNPHHNYKVRGTPIEAVSEEKDIGVRISDNLKPSRHCHEVARKAHGVLGHICRAFHYRDRFTFLRLYKQQVRPLIEFATPVWSPWLQGDIDRLESVQHRFVGMISGLRGATYEEKLVELDMLSLSERRALQDQVQLYKIIHGLDRVDKSSWFKLAREGMVNTRFNNHPLNIVPKRVNLDIYKHFYSNRVAGLWNSLPADMKDRGSVGVFRKKMKDYLKTIRRDPS